MFYMSSFSRPSSCIFLFISSILALLIDCDIKFLLCFYQLNKEKQDRSSTREDLLQSQQQLDVVKREYDLLYANLEQERKTLQSVKV